MSAQSDPSPESLREKERAFQLAIEAKTTAGLSAPSADQYQALVVELNALYVGYSVSLHTQFSIIC